MQIVLDFDGTCVTHDFPRIGKDIGAITVLKELVSEGHNLILFTMRSDVTNPTSIDPSIHIESGDCLSQAVKWFNDNEIPLYGVQRNPTQDAWTSSPKAYGQLIIDDTALGCPLRYDDSVANRPFVDWSAVRRHLIDMGLITLD